MTSLKQSKEQPNVADIFEYKVSNGYRTVLSLYPIAPSKECLLFGICLSRNGKYIKHQIRQRVNEMTMHVVNRNTHCLLILYFSHKEVYIITLYRS